jgi:hypothetical protein
MFLTSEDCGRCGRVCGDRVFCAGCVNESLEAEQLWR